MKHIDGVNNIFTHYGLSKEDQEIIWNIIYPIIKHNEFQKRLNSDIYPHHDKISLGSHIISDAVVSYIISKKKQKNKRYSELDIDLSVVIAMFHDLYELPWQNMHPNKKMYVNKHGFVHPIEAIINAITWYPEYFEDEKKRIIIINSVIHHMYPFPVRAIDTSIENIEINNIQKYLDLNNSIQNLIIESSNMGYIKPLHVSLQKPKYNEGLVLCEADKIVSLKKEASIKGFSACVTGTNSNLKSYHK